MIDEYVPGIPGKHYDGSTIPRRERKKPAVMPWHVELQATENWHVNSTHPNEADAESAAYQLTLRCPTLHVRLVHYTG